MHPDVTPDINTSSVGSSEIHTGASGPITAHETIKSPLMSDVQSESIKGRLTVVFDLS